jgi:3-oxoacyl-[acyl-carrier protein] reductase
VTVDLVAPGRFDTDRVRTLDGRRAAASGTSPDGYPASGRGRGTRSADEVGAMVVFPASDAASYLTGQSLLHDGGLVLHVG